jgi:hypothetical protein
MLGMRVLLSDESVMPVARGANWGHFVLQLIRHFDLSEVLRTQGWMALTLSPQVNVHLNDDYSARLRLK